MESISAEITLPSGATWVAKPLLSHRTWRELDKVGTKAAFDTLAEMRKSSGESNIDDLIAKAKAQGIGDTTAAKKKKKRSDLGDEQDDFLVVASTLSWSFAVPVSEAGFGDLDHRDTEFMIAHLHDLYGLDEPDEGSDEGKDSSAPPSSSQETSESPASELEKASSALSGTAV